MRCSCRRRAAPALGSILSWETSSGSFRCTPSPTPDSVSRQSSATVRSTRQTGRFERYFSPTPTTRSEESPLSLRSMRLSTGPSADRCISWPTRSTLSRSWAKPRGRESHRGGRPSATQSMLSGASPRTSAPRACAAGCSSVRESPSTPRSEPSRTEPAAPGTRRTCSERSSRTTTGGRFRGRDARRAPGRLPSGHPATRRSPRTPPARRGRGFPVARPSASPVFFDCATQAGRSTSLRSASLGWRSCSGAAVSGPLHAADNSEPVIVE